MTEPLSPTARAQRTWQAWALGGFELFVVCQAISGSISLMTDSYQMPTEWLARTPFDSWVGPGWLLIGLIGVPHLLAAVPPLLLPGRPRLGILAGYLAGGSLLVWIAMQLAILQRYSFLQPVIAVMGLIELGLAYSWHRRSHRNAQVTPRPDVAQAGAAPDQILGGLT